MKRVRRFDRIGRIHVVQREDLAPADAQAFATKTPEGYLDVRVRMARDGCLVYSDGQGSWNEYRPADEIFAEATMTSFVGQPITDDHPEKMLDAVTWRQHARGTVRSTEREPGPSYDYLAGRALITDADLVSKVEGGKAEVSIGFLAEVHDAPGEAPDGTAYRYVQRAIRGNHLAVVDEGRAGPDCRILLDGAAVLVTDHGDATMKTNALILTLAASKVDEKTKAAITKTLVDAKLVKDAKALGDMLPLDMVEVIIAGETFLVPTAVAAELEALQQKLAALSPTPAASTEAAPAVLPNPDEEKPPLTPDAARALVNSRMALVADAVEVLGRQPDLHVISDDVLMRRVIDKAAPALKEIAKAAKGDSLRGVYDSALVQHRTRAIEDAKRWDAFGDGTPIVHEGADEQDPIEAARRSRKDRRAGVKHAS